MTMRDDGVGRGAAPIRCDLGTVAGRAAMTVYAGWSVPRGADVRTRKTSVYANPFRPGPLCSRAPALREYEALWRHRLASTRRRAWYERLAALTGQVLGCWCGADEPCHCDVLIRLWHEFVANERGAELIGGGA